MFLYVTAGYSRLPQFKRLRCTMDLVTAQIRQGVHEPDLQRKAMQVYKTGAYGILNIILIKVINESNLSEVSF